MDAVTRPPVPINEPVRSYAPASPERASLEARLKEMAGEPVELTMAVGGRHRMAGGDPFEVVQPHRHAAVLGRSAQATAADVSAAVGAALATVLGQSKSCYQAEIDAACETIDFFRFNVHFGRSILTEQPFSGPGMWNRMDYRPLEGFVLAITPFNFTSIAGNLPLAPALMGNTVVWKPSPTQQLAAHHLMRLVEAAGLPPGVVNMVTGDGHAVSEVALPHPRLAGIHFTGSTATFQHLWSTVGANIAGYHSYPRLVGETGGKDFVIAHPSADPASLVTGLVRGAFEYQGQKCSAASRAYLPRSLWDSGVRDALAQTAENLTYGDVTDFANFGGAVIDRRAFGRLTEILDQARSAPPISVLAGGRADGSEGYFVRPTVLVGTDPTHEIFTREYFGPILGVFVYEDADWTDMLAQAADVAAYALTGAVFATDRGAIEEASNALRFSAGNFYVNDKPTGAVVGQQPFGGARASGTNDKAGSVLNLLRWVSPRTLKETFVPPTDHRHPHMG
jgi:1-pyrroline-5-carboxylate dehydrogenase